MADRWNFATKSELARALAEAIAGDLGTGIEARGTASLCVSGGSTPKKLFETLSLRNDIDWSKVVVTLVDERWVPPDSERSNARLVRQNLIKDAAAQATFVPLYGGGTAPDAGAISQLNAELAEKVPHPFDAVVLGMGGDGHTASFFPDAEGLDEALTGPGPVSAQTAPGADEPRVTWTLPRLLKTTGLYLHIEGKSKADALDAALRDGPKTEMPVRAVLKQDTKPVHIYWCP